MLNYGHFPSFLLLFLLIFLFLSSPTFVFFSHGDSNFPPLQSPPTSGWDFDGKYEMGYQWGIGRLLMEGVKGPFGPPVECSSIVLAAQRAQRKDPLNGFKRYTGGWNISDYHYWALCASARSKMENEANGSSSSTELGMESTASGLAIWEQIELSESYLVCSLYEEAASFSLIHSEASYTTQLTP
ncbi:hypothetical protein ACFX2A_025122 [Malus domestica]